MEVGQRRTPQRIARARKACCELADAPAQRGEKCQRGRRPAQEPGGQQWLLGSPQREADDRDEARKHRDKRSLVKAERRDPLAHQRHCWKAPRAKERRRGEDQRDQQAIGERAEQRGRREHDPASHRQQARQCSRQHRRQRDTGGNSRDAADERRGADFQPVNSRDVAAGRAEHLERRDALPPRVEVRRHAPADPDARDHQGGEPHEGEELAHAPDEAVCAWRAVVPGADFEPGGGKLGLERRLGSLGIARAGEGDVGSRAIHRAGRGEAGSCGHIGTHDHRRPELESFAQSVGFRIENSADD